MDNNELNRIADLIWSTLNQKHTHNLNKPDQIELIKPIITQLSLESRKIGRKQILNYLYDEIKTLREDS